MKQKTKEKLSKGIAEMEQKTKEKLSAQLEEIAISVEKLKQEISNFEIEIESIILKTPDRFLHRKGDPYYGYITPERLNTVVKMLENRIKKLKNKQKGK